MIKRVILLVVEGLGAGAASDASEYGDSTSHTLAHLAEAAGGLSLPSLESLGLGHVCEIQGVRSMAQPIGCFGRLGFKSKGVDSLVGYWEICRMPFGRRKPDVSGRISSRGIDGS